MLPSRVRYYPAFPVSTAQNSCPRRAQYVLYDFFFHLSVGIEHMQENFEAKTEILTEYQGINCLANLSARNTASRAVKC